MIRQPELSGSTQNPGSQSLSTLNIRNFLDVHISCSSLRGVFLKATSQAAPNASKCCTFILIWEHTALVFFCGDRHTSPEEGFKHEQESTTRGRDNAFTTGSRGLPLMHDLCWFFMAFGIP